MATIKTTPNPVSEAFNALEVIIESEASSASIDVAVMRPEQVDTTLERSVYNGEARFDLRRVVSRAFPGAPSVTIAANSEGRQIGALDYRLAVPYKFRLTESSEWEPRYIGLNAVRQLGKPSPYAVLVTVSPTLLELNRRNSFTGEITITTASAWSISGLPEFLKISASSGTGDAVITVKQNRPNTSDDFRTSTISVYFPEYDKTLAVQVREAAVIEAKQIYPSENAPTDGIIIRNDATGESSYNGTLLTLDQLSDYKVTADAASIAGDGVEPTAGVLELVLDWSEGDSSSSASTDSKGGNVVPIPLRTYPSTEIGSGTFNMRTHTVYPSGWNGRNGLRGYLNPRKIVGMPTGFASGLYVDPDLGDETSTIEVLFRTGSNVTAENIVVGYADAWDSTSIEIGLTSGGASALMISGGRFIFRDPDSGDINLAAALANTLYHIVMKIEAWSYQLYINGAFVGDGYASHWGGGLQGVAFNDSGRGIIHHARIFNKLLSDAKIAGLYNSGKAYEYILPYADTARIVSTAPGCILEFMPYNVVGSTAYSTIKNGPAGAIYQSTGSVTLSYISPADGTTPATQLAPNFVGSVIGLTITKIGEAPTYITVDPETLEVEPYNTRTVEVHSNRAWTLTVETISGSENILVTPESGTGDGSVGVMAYDEGEYRITFETEDGVTTVLEVVSEESVDAYISATPSVFTLFPGSQKSLQLSTNQQWITTYDSSKLTVSPASSSEPLSSVITVTALSTTPDGLYQIIFKTADGAKTATVSVTVRAEDPEDPYLTVNPDIVYTDAHDEAVVSISSNRPWVIEADQDRMTAYPTSGTGNEVLSLFPYEEGQYDIVVRTTDGSNLSADIMLFVGYGGGGQNISVTPTSLKMRGGDQTTVQVATSKDWTAEYDSSKFTVFPSSGTGTGTPIITALSTITNGNYTIRFTTSEGGAITLPITVADDPYIRIAPTYISRSGVGEFSDKPVVQTNVAWQVTSVPVGITLSRTSGNGTDDGTGAGGALYPGWVELTVTASAKGTYIIEFEGTVSSGKIYAYLTIYVN